MHNTMKFMSILSISLLSIMGCEKKTTGGIPAPLPGLGEKAPTWSFGGDMIAFFSVSDSLGEHAPGIYISDSLGNSRRPTGIISVSAKWLPGDTEMIANSGVSGPGGFTIFNLNTGATRTLGLASSFPQFDVSDDGKFIYYVGPTIDSIWATGIYRYDMSNGTVLAFKDGWTPAISPDGSVLTYARATVCTQIIGDTVENCVPGLDGFPVWPIWSEVSQEIIYSNGRGEIHVTDLSGRDRFLSIGAGFPSLSRDGLSILFSRPSSDFKMHIWRVNVDGTELRQVTR